ncbi:50S ribosomal protein L35 [Rickettsiales bacterium LUAb2]
MPKLKTKSAAKKRFKVTASGLVAAKYANKSHFLRRRPKDMKRSARGMHVLSKPDQALVKTYFRG